MKNNINVDCFLSRIGLGLILCYCILASIYYSYFAQMHIYVNFLPFPIFVSEILMFICLPLLAWVCRGVQQLNHRTVFLLSIYFCWVLGKALINYHFDGPLTCRNAALFYYPIFAVFAYHFYQKAKVSKQILTPLIIMAAAILFFKVMITWYWWTYVTILVLAIMNIKNVRIRWLCWALFGITLLLGKEYFYQGPRAHFLSVLVAVIFEVFYFGIVLSKNRFYFRLGLLLVSLVLFISGFMFFSEKNSVSSVTSIKKMARTYQAFDKKYKENKANYVPAKLTVQLYHPKECSTNFSMDIVHSRIERGRSLNLNLNNIVFRLFVWRDMIDELIQQRAWWGFSFGHPQRSESLEVLNWASTEWSRDGWIMPHNSFLHILYRAGILGLLFMGILIFMFCKLVSDFFKLNSIEGGLLTGCLVYWFVLSNFFVILEFPYNAIVIWSLFGITLAYRDGCKAQEK